MAPKIYHLHPLVAGELSHWPDHFARCRAMGFDTVCLAPPFMPGANGDIYHTADHETLHPALGWHGSADAGIAFVAQHASQNDLRIWLDVSIVGGSADAAIDRLGRLATAGVSGFRCLDPEVPPPALWRQIIDAMQARQCRFLAWTPGVAWAALPRLEGIGFDNVCSSVAWWDGRSPWLMQEFEALRRIAPVIASTEPSFHQRRAIHLDGADITASHRLALGLAAATADGIFVPMGFEYVARRGFDAALAGPDDLRRAHDEAPRDLSADIAAANTLLDRVTMRGGNRVMRQLTTPHDRVTALLRADAPTVSAASSAVLVLFNPDIGHEQPVDLPLSPLPPQAGAALTLSEPMDCSGPPRALLRPGEVRVLGYTPTEPITHPTGSNSDLERKRLETSRIAIENVQPSVPDGNFAVKSLVGQRIAVSADIFADGHDVLSAELLWNTADEAGWHRVPMQQVTNDRWQADFAPERIGRHRFTVEAWWNAWETLRHDLSAKHAAGQVVTLEIEEARHMIEAAARDAARPAKTLLSDVLARLPSLDEPARVALLLTQETAEAMYVAEERLFTAQHVPAIPLEVDRPQAGFASWYEMFPRSATHDPARHGTFRDVIARLPRIRDMGFDVLYFPPIHPIGTTNRKGRNNALRAEPGDVGSVYAIGGPEGGHDAVHPQLGTLEDFRALIAAAKQHALEIAVDFAIQCSPDHPWLRDHPDWFRWRPDGSLRFAENPPKKYEDIVNPDFYGAASLPGLWLALRDVVQFWVDQGVRIFRVDNPHTKPLPFWQWMIADIRSRQPEVLFLSEAFTRPKMMYRLAKVGFSQSYTYFTWRNTKQEIIEYLTELNEPPVSEFFRPNFFVNTPDINPPFLQTSGRPGFLIRAALACTLSGLWGMYSGFELCESAPLPGREEYLNSEKYEIRVRDFTAPGNIIGEIATLNRLRRMHPALQSHLGVTFYPAFNEQVLLYGKRLKQGRDMVLVAVSLDPHKMQEASIEIPLWEWGLPDHASLVATDLMRGHQFVWTGKQQRVRLDPHDLPFAIWQVAPVQVP